MGIECGITADSRRNVGVDEILESVRQAGFSSVGISGERIDATTGELLARTGTRWHVVIAVPLSEDQAATLANATRMAERAAAVGGTWSSPRSLPG